MGGQTRSQAVQVLRRQSSLLDRQRLRVAAGAALEQLAGVEQPACVDKGEGLAEAPLLLPGRDSDVRAGFDLLCEQHGLRCHVLAEVDDMALLRLLARDSGAVALVPTVVVRDELQSRQLVAYCVVPDLVETFYAITVKRHFEPPLLKALLGRDQVDVLGMAG